MYGEYRVISVVATGGVLRVLVENQTTGVREYRTLSY